MKLEQTKILTNQYPPEYFSMDLDDRGYPHIAWVEQKNGHFDLVYKFWNGLCWESLEAETLYRSDEDISYTNLIVSGGETLIIFVKKSYNNSIIGFIRIDQIIQEIVEYQTGEFVDWVSLIKDRTEQKRPYVISYEGSAFKIYKLTTENLSLVTTKSYDVEDFDTIKITSTIDNFVIAINNESGIDFNFFDYDLGSWSNPDFITLPTSAMGDIADFDVDGFNQESLVGFTFISRANGEEIYYIQANPFGLEYTIGVSPLYSKASILTAPEGFSLGGFKTVNIQMNSDDEPQIIALGTKNAKFTYDDDKDWQQEILGVPIKSESTVFIFNSTNIACVKNGQVYFFNIGSAITEERVEISLLNAQEFIVSNWTTGSLNPQELSGIFNYDNEVGDILRDGIRPTLVTVSNEHPGFGSSSSDSSPSSDSSTSESSTSESSPSSDSTSSSTSLGFSESSSSTSLGFSESSSSEGYSESSSTSLGFSESSSTSEGFSESTSSESSFGISSSTSESGCFDPCDLTVEWNSFSIPVRLRIREGNRNTILDTDVATGGVVTYNFSNLVCPVEICVFPDDPSSSWTLTAEGCGYDLDTSGTGLGYQCWEKLPPPYYRQRWFIYKRCYDDAIDGFSSSSSESEGFSDSSSSESSSSADIIYGYLPCDEIIVSSSTESFENFSTSSSSSSDNYSESTDFLNDCEKLDISDSILFGNYQGYVIRICEPSATEDLVSTCCWRYDGFVYKDVYSANCDLPPKITNPNVIVEVLDNCFECLLSSSSEGYSESSSSSEQFSESTSSEVFSESSSESDCCLRAVYRIARCFNPDDPDESSSQSADSPQYIICKELADGILNGCPTNDSSSSESSGNEEKNNVILIESPPEYVGPWELGGIPFDANLSNDPYILLTKPEVDTSCAGDNIVETVNFGYLPNFCWASCEDYWADLSESSSSFPLSESSSSESVGGDPAPVACGTAGCTKDGVAVTCPDIILKVTSSNWASVPGGVITWCGKTWSENGTGTDASDGEEVRVCPSSYVLNKASTVTSLSTVKQGTQRWYGPGNDLYMNRRYYKKSLSFLGCLSYKNFQSLAIRPDANSSVDAVRWLAPTCPAPKNIARNDLGLITAFAEPTYSDYRFANSASNTTVNPWWSASGYTIGNETYIWRRGDNWPAP